MFTIHRTSNYLFKPFAGMLLLVTSSTAFTDIAPTPPEGMYIFAHEPANLLSVGSDDYAVEWDRRLRRGCTPGFSCRGMRSVQPRVSELRAARFVLAILTPR